MAVGKNRARSWSTVQKGTDWEGLSRVCLGSEVSLSTISPASSLGHWQQTAYLDPPCCDNLHSTIDHIDGGKWPRNYHHSSYSNFTKVKKRRDAKARHARLRSNVLINEV